MHTDSLSNIYSVSPRIKKRGGGILNSFKLLVCALYISLRVYCLLMCTPGKKGVLPFGETLIYIGTVNVILYSCSHITRLFVL